MFDPEEDVTVTGAAKREKRYWFIPTISGTAVKTGDIQGKEEMVEARTRFGEPIGHVAEGDTIHFSGEQVDLPGPSEEREFVVETAYGAVEEVFEDKVNILLNLYGQKKVYGFSLDTLKRYGASTLRRNDAVMLQAVFRNGTIEGRLVRLGARPETTVEKKKFSLDKEYFLNQDA